MRLARASVDRDPKEVLSDDARLLLTGCLFLERIAHATLILTSITDAFFRYGPAAAAGVATAGCIPAAFAHLVWRPPPRERRPYLAMQAAVLSGLGGCILIVLPSVYSVVLGLMLVSLFHAEEVMAAAITTDARGDVRFQNLRVTRGVFSGASTITVAANCAAASIAILVVIDPERAPLATFVCFALYLMMATFMIAHTCADVDAGSSCYDEWCCCCCSGNTVNEIGRAHV